MKRNVPPTTNQRNVQRLAALRNMVMTRAALFSRLGQQYGGERKLYEALGYKLTLQYVDYHTQYDRQDIAGAIINRPVNATWRGGVALMETDEKEDTALEKAWADIYDRLSLQSKFTRLDKLASIGEYAVLLLGLDDVQSQEEFANPVNAGRRELLYVKPFSQQSAEISEWESDPNSDRYGLPSQYDITLTIPGSNKVEVIRVHASRVLHVAYDLMEDEVRGTPRLKKVFNRLWDLEKIVGGSAEMFWKGARPGYQGKVDPEYTMTSEMEDDMQNQIDEFEHELRRIMVNEGVELNALAPQVADPSQHVDIQLQMISAETGIPKRILVGSERGELASTEDRDQWNNVIQSRREEYAEPLILQRFVKVGIEYGFLPVPKQKDQFSFMWTDLFAPSDKEKAEVGEIRSRSLANYTKNPLAPQILPPSMFSQLFLGLNEEDQEMIEVALNEQIVEEQAEIREEQRTRMEQQPPQQEEE